MLLGLVITMQPASANDTTVRFTATVDRIVGLEGANLSGETKEVQGEISFTESKHLEPGFYDGHTWQNAVKQITFDAPINATFSGMGVALYPDQNFISVFYSPDQCRSADNGCSASGTSTFTLQDGTQADLKVFSYHIHQPDVEQSNPQLSDVIENFIANAGKGTTKALIRYQGTDSPDPVLTLVITIDSIVPAL